MFTLLVEAVVVSIMVVVLEEKAAAEDASPIIMQVMELQILEVAVVVHIAPVQELAALAVQDALL